jgi:dimethylglycine catabolism A
LDHKERQRGAAVLLDMDHTDGTYAATELLHRVFDRVVVITPRDSLAQDTYLVTRQGILRRLHGLGIEIALLSEPRWSGSFEEEGRLEYANVYTERRQSVSDVAFFAYSTARTPDDTLAEKLRAAGVGLHLIGDARVARDAMAATAEGHAVGASL